MEKKHSINCSAIKFFGAGLSPFLVVTLLACFLAPVLLRAQSVSRATRFGNTNHDEGMRARVDKLGNKYVVGYFSGTVQLSPTVSISSNNNSTDIFIVKYNCQGGVEWAYPIGTSISATGLYTEEAGRDVAIDKYGNVYITGYVNTNFGGGLPVDVHHRGGVYTITTTGGGYGKNDIFVAKYASDGTLGWAKVFGGTSEDGGNGITVNDDSCYVAAFYQGSAWGVGGVTVASNAGLKDIMVIRMSVAGAVGGLNLAGGTGEDSPHSIALTDIDNNNYGGDVYVVGHYGYSSGTSSDITFQLNSGTPAMLPVVNNSSVQNTCIAKIDPAKTDWEWALAGHTVSPATNLPILGCDIVADHDGNILVPGFFSSNLAFQQITGSGIVSVGLGVNTGSTEDIFIVKYNPAGGLINTYRSQGSSNERALGASINEDNELYITGSITGNTDFGSGVTVNAPGSATDIFIQKFTSALVPINLTGQAWGGSGDERGLGIAEEHHNDVMVCGNFSTSVNFGSITLTSAGNGDVFVCQYTVMRCCFHDIPIKKTQTIRKDEVWQGRWLIYGNITVDGVTLDITNCDLIFGQCIGINVINGGRLVAYNAVLRPCDNEATWKGLHFDNTSTGIINSCMFVNANTGILLYQNTAGVKIIHNNFQNNRIGVFAYGSTVTEPLTNNQFVFDDVSGDFSLCDPAPAPTYTGNDHYGIFSEYSTFSGGISQNNFEFSASTVGGLQTRNVKGIHFAQSVGTITFNNFTNLNRSFEVADNFFGNMQGLGIRFENNKIEVKRAFAAGNHQVGIYACSTPVIIMNNEIISSKETNGIVNNAIYADGVFTLYVYQNTIKGFRQAIYCAGSTSVLISENTLFNPAEIGIFVINSTNTTISCNQIDMDDMFQVGRYGIYISDPPPIVFPSPVNRNIKIYNNCITDAYTPIYLFNNSGQPYLMPEIRNNFLYNYSNAGIYNWQYAPTNIGINLGDPGLNTFQSNSTGTTDIFSSIAPLVIWGNWPAGLTVSPTVVNLPPPFSLHSTASCGKQTSEVDPFMGPTFSAQHFAEEVNRKYKCNDAEYLEIPLEALFMSKPILKDNFADDLKKQKDAASFTHTLIAMQNALITSDKTEAAKFNATINSFDWVPVNSKAWLNYQLEFANGRFARASVYLQQVHPVSQTEVDLKIIESAAIQLMLSKQPAASVLDQGILEQLDVIATDKTNPNCNRAVSILKLVHGKYDYLFNETTIPLAQAPVGSKMTDVNEIYLSAYPNPATKQLTVEYRMKDILNSTFVITDITGHKMAEYNFQPFHTEMSIDISGLKPGIYIGSIENGSEQKHTVKIVKQ